MKFKGRWHIYEMGMWDEDYFNAEVQAYIQIGKNGTGDFQFGYVWGEIDGKLTKHNNEDRFEFSFAGNDENDPASGWGWIKLKGSDKIEGEFRFHMGDDSTFIARSAKE